MIRSKLCLNDSTGRAYTETGERGAEMLRHSSLNDSTGRAYTETPRWRRMLPCSASKSQ